MARRSRTQRGSLIALGLELDAAGMRDLSYELALAADDFAIRSTTPTPNRLELPPDVFPGGATPTKLGLQTPVTLLYRAIAVPPEGVDIRMNRRTTAEKLVTVRQGNVVDVHQDALTELADCVTPGGRPCEWMLVTLREPTLIVTGFARAVNERGLTQLRQV